MKHLILFVLLLPVSILADNKLEWNGFASMYATKALDKDVPGDFGTTDVSFEEYSRFGLNIRKEISDKYEATAQLLASGNGEETTIWQVNADWANLVYHHSSSLAVVIGRQLFPLWNNARYVDVGIATNYIRMPFHVYYVAPIKSFNGIGAYYTKDVNGNPLTFNFFYGYEDADIQIYSITASFNVHDIYGVSVNYEVDDWLFRLTASHTQISSTFTSTTSLVSSGTPARATPISLTYQTRGSFVSAGVRFDNEKFFAEIEGAYTDNNEGTYVDPATTGLVGGKFLDIQKAGYALFGMHVNKFKYYYIYHTSDREVGFAKGVTVGNSVGINFRHTDKVSYKAEYSEQESFNGSSYLQVEDKKFKSIAAGVDYVF